MAMARFFDWFLLASLATLACLGFGRAFMLSERAISVVAIDRRRSVAEIVADLLSACVFCLWVYEIVAYSWPLETNIVPQSLGTAIVDAAGFKVAGAALMLTGLAIYGVALWHFGSSWRLGIDRDTAGALVTSGIFAWTRNPIYVGLDFLAVGTFLIQGRLIFLLLACTFVGMLHLQIRREEHFLAGAYGKEYWDYCARVPRYVRLRRIDSVTGRRG